MSALIDLYDDVKGMCCDWADKVYIDHVPENEFNPNDNSVLINDAYQRLGEFGSNTPASMSYSFGLQVFYSLDNSDRALDYDATEQQLIKSLYRAGYQISDIKGRITDPDTDNVTQSFLIQKEKGI